MTASGGIRVYKKQTIPAATAAAKFNYRLRHAELESAVCSSEQFQVVSGSFQIMYA